LRGNFLAGALCVVGDCSAAWLAARTPTTAASGLRTSSGGEF